MKSREKQIDVELYPEFDLEISSNNRFLLIKHDYYSSDNDHGKELMESVLRASLESGIRNILIIDSGVRLLDPDSDSEENIRVSDLLSFAIKDKKDINCYVCETSLGYYRIDKDILPEIYSIISESEAAEIIVSMTDAVVIG